MLVLRSKEFLNRKYQTFIFPAHVDDFKRKLRKFEILGRC